MPSIITGRTGDWELVIGLEVHAQITSQSKLFSGAATAFGAEPNSQVSFVDAAMPGMLPVLNATCVAQAVRTGFGLQATIQRESVFARKNYFYPDLPQGYQISQYDQPIVTDGTVIIDIDKKGATKTIGIERLHVEQDAGKSLHDQHPAKSYIDLNRSGVALMEIVTHPDLRSSEEAASFLTKLRSILRYLETCDGNMEEGSMRCDANVSVRRPGDPLGTRCEIKNINSIRFVKQAIDYEAARQVEILEDGGTIRQETRLFDSGRGETRAMRSKEEAHDYRYFPCPDLLPLVLGEDFIAGIQAALPELPDAKKTRFIQDYGLSVYDAAVLVADRASADYYEQVARGQDPKLAANWVITELFGHLNKHGRSIDASPVTAAQLGGLVALISDGTISGRIAKDVFEIMFETGRDADAIVEERGLKQVSDSGAIEGIIDAVLAEQAAKVKEYLGGKEKLFGFFVGQVMKKTGGKANPKVVNGLLRKKLGALSDS